MIRIVSPQDPGYRRMLAALRRRRDAARRRNPGHAAARVELRTVEDCRQWRAKHGMSEAAFRESLDRLHAMYWALEVRLDARLDAQKGDGPSAWGVAWDFFEAQKGKGLRHKCHTQDHWPGPYARGSAWHGIC